MRRRIFFLDETVEKEEGFRFQTSQEMNGKTGEKAISRMHCKPYDINLDNGFIAVKAQEKNIKIKIK